MADSYWSETPAMLWGSGGCRWWEKRNVSVFQSMFGTALALYLLTIKRIMAI